ncbi:MAG: HepT-like ribonuclease domain-containing protein [candidate division WOR-3 bacterium]
MRNDDLIRLQHMLDAARLAINITKDKNRNDLDKDIKLVLAVIKAIEIIGEAANKVTE